MLASLQNIPPKFEVFVAVYSGLGVHIFAGVAELADAKDLKSFGEEFPCRFESGHRHLVKRLRQIVLVFFLFSSHLCPEKHLRAGTGSLHLLCLSSGRNQSVYKCLQSLRSYCVLTNAE